MKKHLAAALGLAFLLFIAIPGLADSIPKAFSFQTINFAGDPLGMNDEGEAVGFYVDSAGATHGLVYENGVYASVDDPFGIGMTTINGINDKGQIVGFYGPGGTMDNGFLGSPTPESASLLLVGTGLLGLALVLRRRKQASGAR